MMKPAKREINGLTKILDKLVQAGWITTYAQCPGESISIEWSEEGYTKFRNIWRLFRELDAHSIDRDIWWFVAMLARDKFERE